MRLGILGAGAIGCYLGGRLIASGEDVVMVGRKSVADSLAGGMTLTDDSSEPVRLAKERIRFELDAAALRDADVVFVTVKSAATESAGAELAKIVRPNAIVVSFQNGVRNPARLKSVLSGARVLGGMVPFNVTRSDDGRFHRGTRGPLIIEAMRGASETIVPRLIKAGFPARAHGNIAGVLWCKLLFNLNNALNALAGIPLYQQLMNIEYRRLMAGAIDEGRRVLAAEGIRPERIGRMHPGLAAGALRTPTWLFKRLASAMAGIDKQARSSMWDDLERKRTTEVDELNGEIVRLAAVHGIAVPINASIVRRVKEAEANRTGSPNLEARAIYSAAPEPT